MQINKLLNQLGFSDNETKVYIATLECGVSSAQDIAKKALLPRTTVYSVLKYLVERGVVGKSLVKGKTRFSAEPPSKLVNILGNLKKKLEDALPELEAIYNKNETKPKITFFEGKNAVQAVYDDTLKEKPDEILEWNTEEYFKYGWDKVDPDYISKRIKHSIKARRLAGSGSHWHRKHRLRDKGELSDTLIVPKEQFWPEVEVNIYGNKVAFLNYAENMSIIIESKAIADVMRQAYELSWKGGKQVEVGV